MTLAPEESLVKSRDRVKAYGEVFTPRHMVEQMIDVVAEDVESIDKTVLEPAAGDGNFLVAILERKLRTVGSTIEPGLHAQESLFALASIYGVELLEDNHADAKAAMLETFLDFHRRLGTPCRTNTHLYRAAAFLIDANIVRGNTLTGLDPAGEEFQLSWWNRSDETPGYVLREPFTLSSLREEGLFDFAVYESYAPCAVDKVYLEVRA